MTREVGHGNPQMVEAEHLAERELSHDVQSKGPAQAGQGESVPDLVAAHQLTDLPWLEPPERHCLVRIRRIRPSGEIARDLQVEHLIARSVRWMVLAEGHPGSRGVAGLLQELAPRGGVHRLAGIDPPRR